MMRVCTVEVEDMAFAIRVDALREILRSPKITRVPRAKPVFAGLINLRGHIVNVLDLRQRLALGARADGARPMAMVLEGRATTTAWLVDRVGSVVEVDDTALDTLPNLVSEHVREVVRGACVRDGRLLLILDETRLARDLEHESEGTRSIR
jgi:purine-binding chemotaxis protein CheW